MSGRASVFSNPRVINKLNKSFIPVAIDINIVMRKKDTEGEFFRKLAEQGHYAGRTKPTATRQGLYIATIDGELLSSINTADPAEVLGVMNRALAKWDRLDPKSLTAFAKEKKTDPNYQVKFPEGGLILRETIRDLPRTSVFRQTTDQHNFDHVWLTAEEVKSFVPENLEKGTEYSIPAALVHRIAKNHFIDQVRGEADRWDDDDIKKVALTAKVVGVSADRVKVQLMGVAKCIKPPSGERNPFNGYKIAQDRSVDLKLRGWLVFNTTENAIEKFDFLAVGDRAGTAVYNFRHKDMGPEPIGFAFELLPTKPKNMIHPKFITWQYFE